MEKDRIAWHPAFFEAVQLELEPYLDALEFLTEYQLTSEPLKIDSGRSEQAAPCKAWGLYRRGAEGKR